MPDEERVRTKRRKLENIITKLHQETPLGTEIQEEGEEKLIGAAKENDLISPKNELLPGSSKRKLHRAVKHKHTEEGTHPQEKPLVTDDDGDLHFAENGMELEDEQAVPCSGESDTNKDIQEDSVPVVVKKEPEENIENSLEGLQQMLGFSISGEEVKQREGGGEKKKKKRLLSEGSDAEGNVLALPRRVECTACGRNVNPAHGTICRHPCLNVLVCKKCSQYYNSGPFTRDELGVEEQCRWCGDGGSLICCDKCDKAFCKKCIRLNLGKAKLKELVNAPEEEEWLCFACNPKPLSRLVKTCNQIMNLVQTLKSQKTIFKTKKGPSLTGTPNQSERRNRLSSLTENLGMGSDDALSPSETLTKKHGKDDSDSDNSALKKRKKKSGSKEGTVKENGLSKGDVFVIDDDSDCVDIEESVKGSSRKTNRAKANQRTKRKLDVRTESEHEESMKDSKTKKARKTKTTKGSSNDSDSVVTARSKSKSTRKGKQKKMKVNSLEGEKNDSDSQSDSDFVSMVKQKGKKSKKDSKVQKRGKTKQDVSESEEEESEREEKPKKGGKKQEKGKSKKPVLSDSEESEEESENDARKKGKSKDGKKASKKVKGGKSKKQAISDSEEEENEEEEEEEEEEESDGDRQRKRSKRSGVSQKRTRKRPRKETTSEEESSSSDDQSDSDVPLTRYKKKQVQKRNKRKTKASSGSDDDEEEKEIGRRKKRKTRQKGRKSSSGSEEDTKTRKQKGKGKGRGKGKGKSKKKHFIVKDSDESEEEVDDDEEEVSPSKRKGRKKIRKLIEDEKLAEETQKARRLEEERRKRLLERTQNNEDDMPGESAKVASLVLESDPSTKEPTVEVKEDLLQHLKPHQCKGIQFMYDCIIESLKSWKKEDPGGGCILAHCMGLGKTLQVVALVHTLMTHEDIKMQRVLVVAPLNTVLNWQVEFDKWLSVDDRLEVFILQDVGGNNWRRADMLKHWSRYGGVMIVGYSMYRNLSQCYRVRSKHQKKIFQEALVDPGPDLVICDEGHILRNDGSAISKALNGIKTKRRIVLTGTPLQNNLIEYHCMVSFVKPNLLGTRKEFTNTFVNPIENGQCADSTALDVQLMKQRCHVLHKMLEGCVQRRDYSVLVPFLPRKHEYVIKVRVSALQEKLYRHFLNTFIFQEGDFSKKAGVSLFSDYQALMRIWTHPWCLKLEALRRPETFADTDSMDDFVVHSDEEEEEEEQSESEQSTTSVEEVLSSSGSEDARGRKTRGGRRGKKVSSEEENEDDDDESEEEVLPQSSRSRAAAIVRSAKSSSKASPSTVNIDGEDVTVVSVNDGASTSRGNRRDKQAHSSKSNIKEDEETKSNGRLSRNSSNNSDLDGVGSTRSGTNFKDFEVEKEWYDEFLTEADEFNVELSGKMVLLMEILADAEAVGDKVLVFSHSLVTLDLIERVLGGGDIGGDRENWCRGCDYFRMDGSTSATMRQRWADIFNDEDNKTARLFLISTKAGGLGINLVAANRVIVFDVSWNPSHDVQSIFRVYRFGQTKAVYVYRFIAQGTMEEKIYDRQVTKLSMAGRVVDEQQIERHFTAADLRELYTFTPDLVDEGKASESEDKKAEAEDKISAAEDKESEAKKEAAAGNETETAKEPDNGAGTGAGKETDSKDEQQPENGANAENDTETEKTSETSNQAEGGVGTDSGAGKETEATKEKTERPTLPLPKDAILADLINRLHPKWIVNYHEHDSLLQNIESEELTEEEMKAAWEAYEAEKSGQTVPARMTDQLQDHAQTQQQVMARVQLNTEMLQQIQQIRQLQRMQQVQEIEDHIRQVRQQRQMYQQQRDALLQQHHQRQQEELRRQNQLRFIQHMTQSQPDQRFQLGQNTINVQTQLPSGAAAAPNPTPPQPLLRFHVPANIRLPDGVVRPGPPPTINARLGPRLSAIVGALPNTDAQLTLPPQSAIQK